MTLFDICQSNAWLWLDFVWTLFNIWSDFGWTLLEIWSTTEVICFDTLQLKSWKAEFVLQTVYWINGITGSIVFFQKKTFELEASCTTKNRFCFCGISECVKVSSVNSNHAMSDLAAKWRKQSQILQIVEQKNWFQTWGCNVALNVIPLETEIW